MFPNMTCRVMEERDVDRVVPLYIGYYNACENAEWTEKTARTRIHEVWSRESALCLILEDGGEPAGFVMGYFRQYDDLVSYDLDEILVARAYQGKGVGTCFFGLIEREIRAQGAAMIQLLAVNDVMHDHFYGKLGFKNCSNLVLKSKWLTD